MKIEKDTSDKFGFPYIAYISDELSENPAVILHLHGAGERGDGKNLDMVLLNGFPQLKNWDAFKDCILIMPQCPENIFWAAKVESLLQFLNKMIALYHGDKSRIYLTGLSMGGYGTWYMAEAYPELFAAIAPCCGGGMPWNAGVLKMPIWAFHGAEDTTVSPFNSIQMVEKLKEQNANVRFDLYEGVGHDSWVKAYSPELMEWLLKQKKS